MKTKVTDEGVVVPKKFLKGIKEVEIRKAVEIGNRLLTSPSVKFVQVDEKLFKEGWEYFQLHEVKDYSLTDCVSFIVMKALGIETAFAFD